MIPSKHTTFLALLVCISCVIANTSVFNSTQEVNCLASTGGCSFFDANIWENNAIPQIGTDVVITGSYNIYNSSLLIFVPANNDSAIGSFSITNVEFIVAENTTFSFSGITFGNNSILVAASKSQILSIDSPVDMPLYSNSTLNVYGVFAALNVTNLYGNVNVYAGARLYLVSVVYDPESFNVDPAANITFINIEIPQLATVSFLNGLNVSSFTVQENSTVLVNDYFNTGSLYVAASAEVKLNNVAGSIGNQITSVTGLGSLTLAYSNITITSGSATPIQFNGTLTLIGSNVVLQQLQLINLVEYIDAASTVSADGLTLLGSVYLPGGITVSGRGLTVVGNLTANGYIYVYGSLEIASSGAIVTNTLLLQVGTTFKTGGYLSVLQPFYVSFNCSLITTHDAILHGNLINQGLLDLGGDRHLTVFGNVTLAPVSSLYATLTDPNQAVLVVDNGTLAVNGTLHYKMDKTPLLKKSVKFLVAQVVEQGSVVGLFSESTATALKDSEVNRDLAIAIGAQTVTIEYYFNAKDVPWWVWLLLSVGVVAIVVTIALVAKKCRRHDYEPVR